MALSHGQLEWCQTQGLLSFCFIAEGNSVDDEVPQSKTKSVLIHTNSHARVSTVSVNPVFARFNFYSCAVTKQHLALGVLLQGYTWACLSCPVAAISLIWSSSPQLY